MVIDICHYQPLCLKDVTDIVIHVSVLIMSFLVIITSLIDFIIRIIIEKMLISVETCRCQIIKSVLVIGTYLK